MKVAITGGSGVVGAAVLRHLLAEGHEVRALSRSRASGAKLADLGAVPVPGNVLDYASLRELANGCERVFHVAGVNELCSPDPDQMWRVNVEGTRLALNACRQAGVARFVFTSSVVTIGEADGETADESTEHQGVFLSHYARTKYEAEMLLFREARDIEAVAVNPASVQGPGRDTGTGKLVLDAARGKVPFLIDTTVSFVDIDDCARGHILAGEQGIPGERYILSGATLDLGEAIDLLSGILETNLPKRFLGPRALRVVAAAVEAAYRPTGRRPPICREAVRVMSHGHRYHGSKATRELGLAYTPIEDTLVRTIEWFRRTGRLET